MRSVLVGVAAVALASLQSCASAGAGDGPSVIDEFRAAHSDFVHGAVSDAPVRLSGTYMPGAELHNEPGEFDLAQWTLDATVPIPISRDSFFITGAIAGMRDYDFDGVPTLEDETLHRYGPRIGFGHFVNDDLVVQGYWQPSIFSDLDGSIGSDDLRLYYARGLAVWRASEDLYLKAGVILTDAVDTGALPLGGVVWHASDTVRFETLLPRDAKVVWQPSKQWTLSSGFQLESNEYHIRGPEALGKPEHDVHVQEVYAFVGAEAHHTENLSTFVRVGVPVAGNYDWSYGTGAPDYDNTLEPTPFATVGLGWRF